MSQNAQLEVVRQMLESAEGNLRSAKQLLGELTGMQFGPDYSKKAVSVGTVESSGRVIEGVFDGKFMIGPDKRPYPVAPNYASKSKLVAGDVLKLTVTDSGDYIYKQIGPVARRKMIGTLTQEGSQYKVLAGGKAYEVLMASITYFKAQVGDQISIILPEDEDPDWAAVDNLIVAPKDGAAPTEDAVSTEEDSSVEEASPESETAVS